MLLIATFAALVVIRYLALLVLVGLIIRPVRACPACFSGTIPVQNRWLRALTDRYEWRWCPACGWQAIARRLSAQG
jgi:hypothetical protein